MVKGKYCKISKNVKGFKANEWQLKGEMVAFM